MSLKIYGQSDDLIEVEGDLEEEFNHYGTSKEDPIYLQCSDGTEITAYYGNKFGGVWDLTVTKKGKLFNSIEKCSDEEAEIYSDIVYFSNGIEWVKDLT